MPNSLSGLDNAISPTDGYNAHSCRDTSRKILYVTGIKMRIGRGSCITVARSVNQFLKVVQQKALISILTKAARPTPSLNI
jgi:hypothetical protein